MDTLQETSQPTFSPAKKRVVIAGCGFGGLRVAERLRKKCGENIEIIAIDNADCHTFAPALYAVATGETSAQAVCEPLSVIFIRRGIKYVQEKIVKIDIKKKQVRTAKNIFQYDFLVLAVGSEVNYYGIKGIKENSFPLKTKEDAYNIFEHIQEIIEDLPKKQLHRFVVLGGGVTGVELASELKDHLDFICKQNNIPQEKFVVMIVHALEHLMPGFPEKVQRFCEHYMADHGIVLKLNSPVVHAKNGVLVLKTGEIIKADTVIWAGGIKANKLLSKIELPVDGYGIKVNEHLQSIGECNVYAIGDCMNYVNPKTNKPVLKTAQNALLQAGVVAENICKAINSDNKIKYSVYKPKETPVLISLGKKMGLFVWKKIWFRGYWMMKVKDYIEKEYMWKIRL